VNDHELRELYKNHALVADIIKRMLEWLGHAFRMDQKRMAEKKGLKVRREVEENYGGPE
jgi:hypothetical protein